MQQRTMTDFLYPLFGSLDTVIRQFLRISQTRVRASTGDLLDQGADRLLQGDVDGRILGSGQHYRPPRV